MTKLLIASLCVLVVSVVVIGCLTPATQQAQSQNAGQIIRLQGDINALRAQRTTLLAQVRQAEIAGNQIRADMLDGALEKVNDAIAEHDAELAAARAQQTDIEIQARRERSESASSWLNIMLGATTLLTGGSGLGAAVAGARKAVPVT